MKKSRPKDRPAAPAEPSPPPPGKPLLPIDPQQFQRRLTITTLSLLLMVLVIYLLRQFAAILQPLFIAAFILYLILPVHRWLVGRHVPSKVAYVLILALVLGALFGVGRLVYDSAEQLARDWGRYEDKLDAVLLDLQRDLSLIPPGRTGQRLRDLFHVQSLEQVLEPLRAVVGTFIGFFTGLAVVAVYLVFLVAEKLTFPERLDRAFGKERADHIRSVFASINEAITRYLAVKTFVNLLVALVTMLILAAFRIPFVPMWGILTFLLLFIPYLGSVIAAIGPLLVCLLEYSDRPWIVLIVAGLLIGAQQFLGNYVEPRMLGRRLGVSPLLILLSLSFWGVLWGVIGMILAVPLLMVLKIVLDNITETRPIATLMSSD